MSKLYAHMIILSFIFYSTSLFAQTPKEIKGMKKSAENYFSVENYDAAYSILKELRLLTPTDNDVNFLLGICELDYKKNYSGAISYFESIRSNRSDKDIPIKIYDLLGDAYHFNYDFDSAIKYYKKYRSLIPKNETKLKQALNGKIKTSTYANQLFASPKEYTKINLGGNINSDKGDYAPVISADETTLIFTSRRIGGINSETNPLDGDPYEDIYISHKQPNNEWGEATWMSGKINSEKHDASAAITADGQKLFIYRSNKNGKKGKIYESYLNGTEWEEPIPIGTNINSGDWVTSVSITPDEQTLYFTSNNKSGFGGGDIYVSHKMDNGTWGVPKNLGATVNTIHSEESPFIHPDGKTLFFSSKGHNNMGGYDVFKTVFDGELWSKPENLGYPLNTTKDDLHFVLSANGKSGYYTSTGKGSYGKEDVYQIIMTKTTIPLTMIRGTILCADSLKPLNVIIKVKDVETNQFIKHVYRPNPQSGKYLIILPPGKNYDMIITTEGYIPYKMNVFIPEQKEFYELYQTIYIKGVHPFNKKLGQGISVDNSFFNTAGSLVDIGEQTRMEQLRQARLQKLLNDIINTSDSLSMNNLNKIVESNFNETYKTIIVDTTFSSLLNLVNQVFENTDTTALKHVNNIIERGFYTSAEKNIYFYGNGTKNLKDTIRVNTNDFKTVQPLNYTDSNSTESNYSVGEKNENLVDEKIKNSNQVLLQTVLFAYKKATIKKEYVEVLDQLIVVYKDYPYMQFSLTGHTDNVGSNRYNLALAKKRVKAIENYLLKKGVQLGNIKIEWKGETSAIKTNNTEQGRAKNRRVEIRLIENY
jgi:outer membrane protein OmpA-like peptidoglycan-associated protein/tetratricopeptide (TPR) repeat protein